MSTTLTILDETASGQTTNRLLLSLESERITVRELIRERVYEEVRMHNAALPDYFQGLVQPTETEATLNGYKLQKRRLIDWEKQYVLAIAAFERNGFFVLVGDRQVESLDDYISVSPATTVSFVKLVPLVGG